MNASPLKFVGIAVLCLFTIVPGSLQASADIVPMTWTMRSDWVNVKSAPYNAVGNGTADDTAAIQAALNAVSVRSFISGTVYLPPGTYRITSSLTWAGTGMALIGHGKDTVIKWDGSAGGTMMLTTGASRTRFIGIDWQGSPDGTATHANRAAYGIDHTPTTAYESRTRHENEAFRNFTTAGIRSFGGGTATNSPTAETLLFNCLFLNCATGIINGSDAFNNYQWLIEGSEFRNCGTAIRAPKGKCIIYNNRFEGSTVTDISISAGLAQKIRRCVSVGSKVFVTYLSGGSVGSQVIEDCRIDAWTNTTGAIRSSIIGPVIITDCVFTNPPNTYPPIVMNYTSFPTRLMVAGNYCPTMTNLVSAPANCSVTTLPSGSYGSNLLDADISFLKESWPADSTNVIDVTKPPYNAPRDNVTTDSAAAINSAIAAAIAANNGSIVYLPKGRYRLNSTVNVTGGNYKIQGSGYMTKMLWYGTIGTTMMSVSNPQHISLEQFQLYVNSGDPNSTPVIPPDTTTVALKVTSTSASELIVNGVYGGEFPNGNTGAGGSNSRLPGTVLENLAPNTLIYLEHIDTPLTVKDSGRALIIGKFVMGGRYIVKGATYAKTGFLGLMACEGGQGGVDDPNIWDLDVTDNQDIVMSDWYHEQGYNHIRLSRGAGTGTGRVTIGGIKQHNYGGPEVEVNNYAGRFTYIGQPFTFEPGPQVITQTGSNAIDMIFAGCTWSNNPPSFSLGSAARLIQFQNITTDPANNRTYLTDVTPSGWEKATVAGFDDLRQLAWYDLALNYGIANYLGNSSFEPDAVNPAPTSTLGYNPTKWGVTNAIAAGSGVRNATTVSGGSPFGPGSQSLLFVDSTGAPTTGSRLEFIQYSAPWIPDAQDGAVVSFDFRLNATGTNNDCYIREFTSTGTAFNVRLVGNATTGTLSASGGASTYALTPGTWYRVQVIVPAPALGSATATLRVTPWAGSGPGTTTSISIGSFGAVQSAGLNRFFVSQSAVGKSNNINFDNISVVTGHPLL